MAPWGGALSAAEASRYPGQQPYPISPLAPAMNPSDQNEFERVIAEGAALQRQPPWLQMGAVGGTAAAIHARHRYSTDTDHVTPMLSDQFEVVRDASPAAIEALQSDQLDVAATLREPLEVWRKAGREQQ